MRRNSIMVRGNWRAGALFYIPDKIRPGAARPIITGVIKLGRREDEPAESCHASQCPPHRDSRSRNGCALIKLPARRHAESRQPSAYGNTEAALTHIQPHALKDRDAPLKRQVPTARAPHRVTAASQLFSYACFSTGSRALPITRALAKSL